MKHDALKRLKEVMRTARKGNDKNIFSVSTNLLRELPALEAQGYKLGAEEYNAVLSFLTENKHLQLAKGVQLEMEKKMLSNKVTQYLLVGLYAKLGDIPALKKQLSSMKAERMKPSASCYQSLLEVASPDGVLKVLHEMKKQGAVRSVTHYNTALKRGTLEQAADVLRMMKADGLKPDVRSYNSLIYACGADTKQAEKVFDLMVRKGIKPLRSSYGSLCGVYKNAGDYEGSLRTFSVMHDSNIAPTATDFGTLIKAIALSSMHTADKVQKAEALFNRAEHLAATSQLLYVKMMEIYNICGDKRGAEDLLMRMRAEGLRPLPALRFEYEQLSRKLSRSDQ